MKRQYRLDAIPDAARLKELIAQAAENSQEDNGAEAARQRMLERMGLIKASRSPEEAREAMIQRGRKIAEYDRTRRKGQKG